MGQKVRSQGHRLSVEIKLKSILMVSSNHITLFLTYSKSRYYIR